MDSFADKRPLLGVCKSTGSSGWVHSAGSCFPKVASSWRFSYVRLNLRWGLGQNYDPTQTLICEASLCIWPLVGIGAISVIWQFFPRADFSSAPPLQNIFYSYIHIFLSFKISSSVLSVGLVRNDEQCEHVHLNQTEHLFESENIGNTFCSNVFQCNSSNIPDTLSDEDMSDLSPLWEESVAFTCTEWCGSALRPMRSMVSAYWLIWRASEAASVGVIHPHISSE